MPEYSTISKQNPNFPEYLDFQALRKQGISHLQQLSQKLWTDYNLHDPGVTILEVLCYAITDLGYRNNLDIQDLLALKPGTQENNFFTPDEILTCNPVTEIDLRKRLIDIHGVHHAWLKRVNPTEPEFIDYEPAICIDPRQNSLRYCRPQQEKNNWQLRFHPQGLYNVYLALERSNIHDNKPDYRDGVIEEVKQVLCLHRNLGEDLHKIIILEEEEIDLSGDILLRNEANPEDVLVEIYLRVQEFLDPHLKFYTLQELLDKGKSTLEIFAGRPSTIDWSGFSCRSHGFIDTEELKNNVLRQSIQVSDLYQEILKIPGILAIFKLNLANYINDMLQSEGNSWILNLTDGYHPFLTIEKSTIKLLKRDLDIKVDYTEVKRRYYEQQAAYIKVEREDFELNLSVPQGTYHPDLGDHFSIQHDFPATYGIGEDKLPQTFPVTRQVQVLQLKGYLTFFDQLLANYLAQLAHVRELFSWEIDEGDRNNKDYAYRTTEQQFTYFAQAIDFPDSEKIIDRAKYLKSIQEDRTKYCERRNQFLDHLLGRFAESFTDYALQNYQMIVPSNLDRTVMAEQAIAYKARFLQDYPAISRNRFRAFNYLDSKEVWNTDNVSGFKRRVCRILGIEDESRRNLYVCNDEGFHVLEHILLRPKNKQFEPSFEPVDIPIDLLQERNLAGYDLSKKSNTGMPGFEMFNRDDGQKYFHFNDCQGNPIFYSKLYATNRDRWEGIKSTIRSSIAESPYLLAEESSRVMIFALFLLILERLYRLGLLLIRKYYFFTLNTEDDEEIGQSRYFKKDWQREVSLNWFKCNVHQWAKEYNLEINVPPDLIQPSSDRFLPIYVRSRNEIVKPGHKQTLTWQDPYSFWVSVILPGWTERFCNYDFRRLVENTLRLEAPAHLVLRIVWVDCKQMKEFETAYQDWLEQLALDANQGEACHLTDSLNKLLAILPQLHNYYPEAYLWNLSLHKIPIKFWLLLLELNSLAGVLFLRKSSSSTNSTLVLNQSKLGTAKI